MNPALCFLALVAGLALLVWSADKFVGGAAAAARLMGVPPLVVGMFVVGFGTSAPELTVSAISAAQGNSALALGNAYGSNICNIGLILGACALLSPLFVTRSAVYREIPPLILVTLLSGATLYLHDGLTRLDGCLFLALFAGMTAASSWQGIRAAKRGSGPLPPDDAELVRGWTGKKAAFWILAGLVLLVVASRLLVWGAVGIAQALGVSDLIIGLTIVAVGTSLPELASSLVAARKGEDDLAVGNIVGSNLFNTLAVVGLAAAIHPLPDVDAELFLRDVPVALVFTLLLFFFGLPAKLGNRRSTGTVNRAEGSVLLAGYAGYLAWIVYDEIKRADAVPSLHVCSLYALVLLVATWVVVGKRVLRLRKAARLAESRRG
ncbi:MAG: calcium/sodium antiporter [Kiritimatiellae bacterium]|nr:calcium/sodium antiporter [Kiritimatiellia bacterium]